MTHTRLARRIVTHGDSYTPTLRMIAWLTLASASGVRVYQARLNEIRSSSPSGEPPAAALPRPPGPFIREVSA